MKMTLKTSRRGEREKEDIEKMRRHQDIDEDSDIEDIKKRGKRERNE